MNEIDWSKAPEFATHVKPGNAEPWRRLDSSGGWHAWIKGHGWLGVLNADPENYFPRPVSVSWSGEGLPPVGTTCEWHPSSDQLIVVTILGRDGDETWFRRKGSDRSETCLRMAFFSPLRTLEQIAAEEREKAIEQMIDDTNILTGIMSDRRIMAGQLYDAGYRKVEGGAE